MCKDPAVLALLSAALPRELEARGVKKYEQPRKWFLAPEPFTVENEFLTPKLSVRKPNVVKAYQAGIEALYE